MKYLLLAFSLTAFTLSAQEDSLDTFDEAAYLEAYQAYKDSVAGTFTYYADTTVLIGEALAALTVPEGYTFIYAEDAHTVLVDLWGNPPSTSEGTLGMLFPEDYGPATAEGYGIDIFYTQEGYIEDDDAADYDYDELLEEMQESTEEANAYRMEEGYEPMHLIGWAATPRYDQANKRLHWAKELYFEGEDANTLNYNILFLGRRGYLTMNVIGGMEDLPEVNENLDDILGSVAYTEGNRYADFNPATDEIAAYGLAALIGAKVLAKTGILASIGIFLVKAWKLILVGVMAAGAGLKKFLGK